jgi:hypothetical protein
MRATGQGTGSDVRACLFPRLDQDEPAQVEKDQEIIELEDIGQNVEESLVF